MSTAIKTRPTTKAIRVEPIVDERVRECLDNCSYGFVFNKVTWQYQAGALTLKGRVPSFYLKQVLQELLRKIERVERIINNVDVVSSTGLSSTSPK